METFTTKEKVEYIELATMIVRMLRWYAAVDDVDGQREVLSTFSLLVANYYAKLGDAKEGNRMLFTEAFIRSPECDDDRIRQLTDQVLVHAAECGL